MELFSFFHLPFPELDHHHAAGAFSAHLYGMYFAFILVSILSGFFLSKMADAIRKSEKDVSDLMIVSADQEKLAALTRLSAGAAHELGSPMGTITIVASELKRQMADGHTTQRMVEDVALISSELSRCRLILDKMSCRAGELVGELPELIGADDLRESIQFELRLETIEQVKFHLPSEFLVKTYRQALIQSLVSLIRNGMDAINDGGTVVLKASCSEGLVEFCIEDNGIGIAEAHINKLGEQFFTTKEPGKGMGLGIFLVKLFAKRMDGRLTFNSQPGFGTKAFLILPATV